MNNDLISRAALIQLLEAKMNSQGRDYAFGDGLHCGLEAALGLVENAPTIEPQVVHGRWLKVGADKYCSRCSAWKPIIKHHVTNKPIELDFCPSCGARMDAEEENK